MIAVLVTLLGRPWNLRTLIENWKKTNQGYSELFFALDDHDKFLPEIEQILDENGYKKETNYWIFHTEDCLEKFYYFYPKVKNEKFSAYLAGSDDVEWSVGWDKEFCNMIKFWQERQGHNLGVYYGDDGIKGQFQATHWLVTPEFLDVLGYFSPIGYMKHCFMDNLMMNLATAIGSLHYCPHIKMLHHCVLDGSNEPDENWKKVYDETYFKNDEREYLRWMSEHAQGKVYQLKEAIKNARKKG